MNVSDPRTSLARPDLADAALEGLVRADRYAIPTPTRCVRVMIGLYWEPSAKAELRSQLLFGEPFAVLELKDGWARGQMGRDGYVGFVEAAALELAGLPPTHRVAVLRAYAFERADYKSPALGPLPINALVRIERREGRYALAEDFGWMFESQLAPLGHVETDFVTVAERFVGAAYLWGGREAQGLDCSGLVQQALFACGKACPRDSDLQAGLGVEVSPDALRRGDLVFWRGHVAIMLNEARVLHANTHHGAVVIEPLAEVLARTEAAGRGAPTAYRRL